MILVLWILIFEMLFHPHQEALESYHLHIWGCWYFSQQFLRINLICLFLVVLGLCCVRNFSLLAVYRVPIVVASVRCCGAQALGTWASGVVAPGFWSTSSVVVAHRLSCSRACEVFLNQEMNSISWTGRWDFYCWASREASLPAILIPACDLSSPAFCMMYYIEVK